MKPLLVTLTGLMISGSVFTATPVIGQSKGPETPQPGTERTLAEASASGADSTLSSTNCADWIRQFEKRFQPIGVAQEGRIFFSGMSPARVGPLDPNYGKELALAYERAMFDMMADFVLQNYGRQIARRRLEVMQDASSNREAFDPAEIKRAQDQGRINALFDKALMLMDKKLDNALISQGVPREKLAEMPVEQKKTLYKDAMVKEVVTQAVRSMRGLVPVQTRIFSESTPNGKASIVCVIAAQSPKTRQFAEDMSRQRSTLVKGEPKKLADLLPSREAEYLDEIGLRFSYDESGRPMLISYGRWSLAAAKDWTPARVIRAKQIAYEQARGLAESSIIEFMNTNIEVSRVQSLGSLTEEVIRKITRIDETGAKGYELVQDQIGETIDKFLRNARSSAAGDLRGTSVAKRWEQTDANGVLHVGTVVTWTFSQVDNAREVDRRVAPGPSGEGRGAGGQRDEARDSKPINRLKDF